MSPANEEPVHLYIRDRTGGEIDRQCGMKLWWNRIEGKRGIVGIKEPFYFACGRATHEDLATIAELENISPANIQAAIDEILAPINEEDKHVQEVMESLYRRLGWLAAYALYLEPRVRRDYENVQTEAEIILDRSPLLVPITPDRVLRHRQGGYLVYREYKTTKYAGQNWINHWPLDIQIHLGLQAIQEELLEEVKFGQVMGLMKGDVRGGRLAHPYVWAYYNRSKDQWTHDYDKARTSDWDHMPVWEYPGGVVEWVQRCGEDVANAQFPHSVPIFLNTRMVNDYVVSRTAREAEIAAVKESCRMDWKKRVVYFEQRTANCRPTFGDPCPYLAGCWNAAVQEAPMASGLFTERTPHHEVELIYEEED